MPDIIRKGVTLAQALQEAAAVAPIYRQMLYCYELWHPTLLAPIYFVNDNGDLSAFIEPTALARGTLDPWVIIERVYASDDLSGPALLPPLEVELTSIDMVGSALQIAAQLDDDGTLAVPAITFRRTEYPGLQR